MCANSLARPDYWFTVLTILATISCVNCCCTGCVHDMAILILLALVLVCDLFSWCASGVLSRVDSSSFRFSILQRMERIYGYS